MEAENLMIGDWVRYQDQNVRVVACRPGVVGIKKEGEDMQWADSFNIESIPITSQFLEKNGFQYEYGTQAKAMHYDSFYIKFFDGYQKIRIIKRLDVVVNVLSIENVHELQHLYRLCGINKEIKF